MDPVTLVISMHMQAENMGVYTQTEFLKGFESMGVSSIEDLKYKLDDLKASLKENDGFKETYRHVFTFLKEEEQRNLKIESALAMWDILLPIRFGNEPKYENFMNLWKEYLKQKEDFTFVKKDEWNTLVDFIQSMEGGDLSKYEDSCWPILFDEFYEWTKT